MWNILKMFYDYFNRFYILNNKVDKLEYILDSDKDLIDELYVLDENKELELQDLQNKIGKLENEVITLKRKLETIEQEHTDYINELYDLYNSLHLN
jgi:hypothetical protein